MSYVLIGGTFDKLHKGHETFIRKAFQTGDKVLVCITSNRMARMKPFGDRIETYGKRKKKVEEFLRDNKWLGKAEFVKIEDPFSEGLRPGLTHIIVTPDTIENGRRINSMRKARDLEPLRIIEAGLVNAKDGRPVSDERIRRGEIDREGELKKRQKKAGGKRRPVAKGARRSGKKRSR